MLLGAVVVYVSRPEPTGDTHEAFEAKKAQAAQVFRQKLDENEPLYMPKDQIELRQNTGQIVRGTLLRYVGTGTNRLAVIATVEGDAIIPINSVEKDARIRMDSEFRKEYVRHMLNIGSSEPQVQQPSVK